MKHVEDGRYHLRKAELVSCVEVLKSSHSADANGEDGDMLLVFMMRFM